MQRKLQTHLKDTKVDPNSIYATCYYCNSQGHPKFKGRRNRLHILLEEQQLICGHDNLPQAGAFPRMDME